MQLLDAGWVSKSIDWLRNCDSALIDTKDSGGFLMQLFRSARWLLLALLLSVFSATSYAGVFISVGFAPPELPVYEQPPCPEPGLMWTPGYWAYGDDGYYWVPGAWVPAPYEGALWTPGYWGWSEGQYLFHDGYWGDHVGYYGGVNYGFGYMGIGFAGGMWRGHDFLYNTEVMRVDNRFIHNTYRDRDIVNRYTVVNDRHVAFSGGPGGIRHDASPEERMAARDQHINRTTFQQQHEMGARSDRSSYFNSNHGRPQNLTAARPLGGNMHAAPGMQQQGRPGSQNQPGTQQQRPGLQNQTQPQQQQRPGLQNQQQVQPQQQTRPGQNQTQPGYQNQQQARPGYQNQTQPQAQPQTRPGFQNQTQQQSRPSSQPQAQPQSRPTYQAQPQQQQRPAQQSQPQSRPQQQSRPAPQAQPSHPAAQQHAAPKEEKPKEH
jgi:hypothetical protein